MIASDEPSVNKKLMDRLAVEIAIQQIVDNVGDDGDIELPHSVYEHASALVEVYTRQLKALANYEKRNSD
jgi:hypothetical protein